MDTISIILTIVGIVVAIVLGLWQISLTKKQLDTSSQNNKPTKIKEEIPQIETTNQNNKQNIIKEVSPININYRERPYPKEIISEINNLPLVQKDSARKHYVDVRVKWRTTIYAMDLMKNDIVHLSMLDRGSYPWVYCEVSINNYPELKTIRQGHELWVEGEIAQVNGNQIYLKKCKIKVD